jgi:small multidrug resistance family-3 protein
MKTTVVYVLAALAEIAGCFSFWAWLRLGKSIVWLIPGMASLASFAYLLTLVDTSTAGRRMPRMAASTSWHRCSGCGQWSACGRTAGTPWARLFL